MERRRFILITASTGLASFSGCMSDDTVGSEGTDESDTETNDDIDSRTEERPATLIERYYMLQNEVESEDDIDQYISDIMELLHSKSPLIGVTQQGRESRELDLGRADVTKVETYIITRDLSASELESEFGLSTIWDIEQATIDAVAQENVIVDTNLERASTESDSATNKEITWLVTKENGEWVLFSKIITMTPDGF